MDDSRRDKKKRKRRKAENPAEALDDTWRPISQRLSKNRKCFDPVLKAQWDAMSKAERKALLKEDQIKLNALKRLKKERVQRTFPFKTEDDDHCETSKEALGHIVYVLDILAAELNKSREELRIYDPYYCDGRIKVELAKLGFKNVYNECEDFYEVIEKNKVPEHDLILTNPPYSKGHIEKLLPFCLKNNKPYLLLMPLFVRDSPEYVELFGNRRKFRPLYLCPKMRYHFWSPPGLRNKANPKTHGNTVLGSRTSPFVTIWFVSTLPILPKTKLLQVWREKYYLELENIVRLCDSLKELPLSGWEGGGGRYQK